MDLETIKQKLEDLNKQSKKSNKSGDDWKELAFKPTIGKQIIRIVPSKYDKSNPFKEMLLYFDIGSKRIIASPQNWGEKDPIQEFAKELRKTNDSDSWRLAKKLDAKVRIFTPVIVREEGVTPKVKLWNFGKELYQEFLNMAVDEEIGDYTDILIGRDIKVTTVGPEVTGTKYNKTTISPSLKTTPLSKDENLVKSLLENQPNPLELYTRYSFEDIKEALQEWLSGSDEEEGEETEVKADTKSNYKINPTTKKSQVEKFDDLFEEETSTEEDDLPF